MKTKLPLIAALYCGLSSIGSAFTLDFSSLNVGDSTTLSVNVPGYGSVSFSSLVGNQSIRTFNPGATKALSFVPGDQVRVTFNGLAPDPATLSTQFIGVTGSEVFTRNPGINANTFDMSLAGAATDNSAGLQSITFDAVPEPSTSLLGAMGGVLLVLRRRR